MPDGPDPLPPVDTAKHAVTEANIRIKSQELGMFGKLFGSRENAPTNVAGALIVIGIWHHSAFIARFYRC
jgi:hypothetical protein